MASVKNHLQFSSRGCPRILLQGTAGSQVFSMENMNNEISCFQRKGRARRQDENFLSFM